MVVAGIRRPEIGRVAVKRRGTESRSFGVSAERAEQTERTVATAGVAATSLLALQEVQSGLDEDRDARHHGEVVIDELGELQRSLLGEDEPDLHRLASLVAKPIIANDPVLAGVLRAVRLRAGIELARRGFAASM